MLSSKGDEDTKERKDELPPLTCTCVQDPAVGKSIVKIHLL